MKGVNKKTEPLPKFTSTTLAIEIPELLERSYRVFKNSKTFTVISAEPGKFLGREGVFFSYEFTDESDLVRKGEARAAIIGEKLYMITFEAPRLNYFGTVPNMGVLQPAYQTLPPNAEVTRSW